MFSSIRKRRFFVLSGLVISLSVLLMPIALTQSSGLTELVPGTAILLDQSSSTTSGNGGNTSSTSTMTNIFSPPAYLDYKRSGSEPVVTVDRYPYPVPTSGDLSKLCPGGVDTSVVPARCYKDIVYADSTEGFGYPAYDFFFKSENLGQTFRLPHNEPTVGGRAIAQGRGGGDGFQAVGDVTHGVFFIDLPATNVTMNISRDGGDTFTSDEFGSGVSSGFDDRQWDATDESFPGVPAKNIPASPNVYINVNDDLNLIAPTLVLTRSTHDGAPGSFITDSPCNKATATADNPNPAATGPASDRVLTRCPDPVDPELSVAGPVIVDKSNIVAASAHPHRLYIPFLRCTGDEATHGLIDCGAPYMLYVARSDDGGTNWDRRPLCNVTKDASGNIISSTGACLGPNDNPRNIFVQMAVDNAGNLYYTWAQRPLNGGETDIYYAYSTTGGETWSPAINLTKETGDSAVFPWMVAGDPGQVDLVYYKANTGDDPTQATMAVWNVYFAQSQNALNTGANFKSVQISDHPNHIGPICTSGLGCSGGRTLGDFFTLDIDHLGAANVVWADDNDSRGRAFLKFSRQLSGNSVFKSTPINLMNSWPIKDHTAFDAVADVITPTSFPGLSPSCASLDIQKVSAQRSADLLTVEMTLSAPPSALAATLCSASGGIPYPTDGGFWGIEFWSSDNPNDNYYLAFIDQPTGPAHVEAGRFNATSFPSLTGNEPRYVEDGTPAAPSGTCFSTPAPTGPCTITMTANLSGLGIKSGAGLYSLTGLSLYATGNISRVPFTAVEEGFTSLADSTAAIDYNGTGTTP